MNATSSPKSHRAGGCGCRRCRGAEGTADALADAVAQEFEAVRENWPPMRHAHGCRCARCRRGEPLIERLADQTLSTALRHAQNRAEAGQGFEAQTPAGKIELPGTFSGWRESLTVAVLFGPNPPAMFTRKPNPSTDGFGLLYRAYEQFKQQPLYIGMAFGTSIRDRILSHLYRVITKAGQKAKTAQVANLAQRMSRIGSIQSEIEKLRILAAHPSVGTIRVQYATVTANPGYPLTPKFLHVFEAALQVLEKPRSYVGSARTFEDALEELLEDDLA